MTEFTMSQFATKADLLEAKCAHLERKIEEHNKRCEDDCGHSMCRPSEMQRCYDCPKDWRIDL
jgi:hypothetical protein